MERAKFAAVAGSTFAVGDTGALTLDEVSDQTTGTSMSTFSLLFRGEVELPQATYSLQHAELGDVQLFLVPVGLVDGHFEYESVFTRMEDATVA